MHYFDLCTHLRSVSLPAFQSMPQLHTPPPDKSHYTRAAEKDFRDCKAMMMGLKVELLVALGEDAANKSRASGSGLGGFMGSMTGGLLGGGGSASASDAKTESDNRLDEAKDLIEELTKELFQHRMIADIPPKVFSYYHFAQMRLFAALTDASAYYQAAVNYVRFTPNVSYCSICCCIAVSCTSWSIISRLHKISCLLKTKKC